MRPILFENGQNRNKDFANSPHELSPMVDNGSINLKSEHTIATFFFCRCRFSTHSELSKYCRPSSTKLYQSNTVCNALIREEGRLVPVRGFTCCACTCISYVHKFDCGLILSLDEG